MMLPLRCRGGEWRPHGNTEDMLNRLFNLEEGQRLLDMGLMPKQTIRMERIALGGAPVWIELNGSHLALRREEAEMILVGEEA